jgi:hypothetical protein
MLDRGADALVPRLPLYGGLGWTVGIEQEIMAAGAATVLPFEQVGQEVRHGGWLSPAAASPVVDRLTKLMAILDEPVETYLSETHG